MKPFIPSIRSLHRCSIAACVGVVFISLSAAAQIYGPPSSNPFYTLRWNETFTGAGGATQSAVNPRDWMWLMGVGSYSTQLPANVSQDSSSNLDIADTEVVAGATYTGGGVISQPTFRFGYFQVRAWTPPSVTGWLTTFSLNGGANAIESWNRRALPAKFTEIDGFNIDSSNPTQMSSGVTSWTGSTATPALCSGGYTNIYNSSPTTPPGPPIDSSAGWHTYGIEWTEGNVAYYVDDYPICSQTYNPATSAASPVNMLLTSIANDASVAGSGKVQFANPQYYVQNYYVNPEDTGYAEYGSGWGVSGVAGFSSQPVRYSCSTSATAVYTPNLLAAGTYEVWVYAIVYSSTQDAATAVTVNTSTGAQSAAPLPATGTSGWVDEGTYSFNADSSSSIMLKRDTNCLRASMVKFVRQS